MSNIPPPPVQEPGSRCPNCGAYLPGQQSYCANCGFGRPAVGPRQNNTAQIVWVVLFILIGLPSLCMGGCFLLMGTTAGANGHLDPTFWFWTLLALGVFVGLLIMVIRSSRRKP